MQYWGLTDVGLVRRDNQDAYRVEVCQATGHLVAVVCDGMGGMYGGSVASNIAADVFMREVCANLRPEMTPEQIRQVASFATSVANTAIRDKAMAEQEYLGMGTTLVSAIGYEGGVVVSNVGDSRAYLIRPEEGISRVTRDHSLVERLVEMGNITEEQARCHPDRNLITRALGPEEGALSDSYHLHMAAGDYLLLCTDGLVETATDQEMEEEVLRGGDPNGCLDRLLALAKRRGAADNVTAVLLQQL